MMKLLNDIHDISTRYPLDSVDCFERVIAIITNWLNPNYDNFYLIYRKLYQSFEYNVRDQENVFRDFSKETGVICTSKCLTDKDHLEQVIIGLIDQGKPVAVPINMKMLFYSRQYMEEDWPHLVLIKGYDSDKRIFYILDSIQQLKENQLPDYVDFAITYECLSDAFEGYKLMRDNCIYYFERSNEVLVKRLCVINSIDLLCDLLTNWKTTEYVFVQERKGGSLSENDVEFILRYPKYRAIAIHLTIKNINDYNVDCDELRYLANIIDDQWQQYNLLFVRNLMRRDTKNIQYELPKTLQENILSFVNKITRVKLILLKMN